jgi:NitT/TauT family transport system substrate-binding protein
MKVSRPNKRTADGHRRRLRQVGCLVAAVLVAATLVGACGGSEEKERAAGGTASEELIPIRIGYPLADMFSLFIAEEQGLFREAGLQPRLISFTSGAPLLAALKSGSIDAVFTGTAVVFAIGQEIPIEVLMWGQDNRTSEGFIVDPEAGVTELDQITNLEKVGMMPGTCTNVGLHQIAKNINADMSEFNIVKVPPALYEASLKSKSIQGGVTWSPYLQKLEAQGYKVLARDPEYGGVCPTLWGARPDFLEKYPDVGKRLVKAQSLALKAAAEDPQLAIETLQRRLKLTPEVAKADFELLCCENYPTFGKQLDPDSDVSIVGKNGLAAQLALQSEALASSEVIPKAFTPEEMQTHINPSYLQQYVKENPDSKDWGG